MLLWVHESVDQDMDEIYENNPDAAADIEVFLEQLESNPDLVERLGVTEKRDINISTYRNVSIPGRINASPFSHFFYAKGIYQKNILRLKDLRIKSLQKYRIIYAYKFTPPPPESCVLAVVHRDDYNYEPNHPITLRIKKDYENELKY